MFNFWPACSKQGCTFPAIFRFEFVDDNGPVTAYLCLACVGQAPKLLREIAEVRKEPLRIERADE